MVSPSNTDVKTNALAEQFEKLILKRTPSDFTDTPPTASAATAAGAAAAVVLAKPVAARFYGTPRYGDAPSEMAQMTFDIQADPLEALRARGAASAPAGKAVQKAQAASGKAFTRLCKTPEADLTVKQRKLLRYTRVLVEALPQVEKVTLNREQAFAIAEGMHKAHRQAAGGAAAYVRPLALEGRELHFEDDRVTLVPSPLNARLLQKSSNKIVRAAVSFPLKQEQPVVTSAIHTISSERSMTPNEYISTQQEVVNLQKLRGVPHVVQLQSAYKSKHRFSLVFEKFAGNFRELRELFLQGQIGQIEMLTFAYGALCGLENMHAAGVAHLDLKPENLFWRFLENRTADAAVGDLGTSVDTTAAKPQQLPFSLTKKVYGSVVYSPPELIRRALGDNPTSDELKRMDVWALGLCLYEFFLINDAPLPQWYGALIAMYQSGVWDPKALVPVFKQMSDMIEEQIIAYNEMPVRERTLTDRMTFIILEMLRMDPEKRSTIKWARMNFAVILKNAKEEEAARAAMATAAAPSATAAAK